MSTGKVRLAHSRRYRGRAVSFSSQSFRSDRPPRRAQPWVHPPQRHASPRSGLSHDSDTNQSTHDTVTRPTATGASLPFQTPPRAPSRFDRHGGRRKRDRFRPHPGSLTLRRYEEVGRERVRRERKATDRKAASVGDVSRSSPPTSGPVSVDPPRQDVIRTRPAPNASDDGRTSQRQEAFLPEWVS